MIGVGAHNKNTSLELNTAAVAPAVIGPVKHSAKCATLDSRQNPSPLCDTAQIGSEYVGEPPPASRATRVTPARHDKTQQARPFQHAFFAFPWPWSVTETPRSTPLPAEHVHFPARRPLQRARVRRPETRHCRPPSDDASVPRAAEASPFSSALSAFLNHAERVKSASAPELTPNNRLAYER